MKIKSILNTTLIFVLLLTLTLMSCSSPPKKQERRDPTSLEEVVNSLDSNALDFDFGSIPNGAILIANRNRVLYKKFKNADSNSRFDLASLTKPLATALAIHHLADHKKINYQDTIGSFVKELSSENKISQIQIHHLLTHHSGLKEGLNGKEIEELRKNFTKAVYKSSSIEAAKGSRFKYSDLNFIILGDLVERVSGLSLEEYVLQNIYQPLNINSLSFDPNDSISTSNNDKAPHDPTAYSARRSSKTRLIGSAGLFGNIDSVYKVIQMIQRNGLSENGKQIISKEAIQLFTRAQVGGRTYGMDSSSGFIKAIKGPLNKGFGHTGYTGTSFYVDLESSKVVILLTNRVLLGDSKVIKSQIARLRRSAASFANQL